MEIKTQFYFFYNMCILFYCKWWYICWNYVSELLGKNMCEY